MFEADSNPLLQVHQLPLFDHIEPLHVEPAVRTLIQRLEQEVAELERQHATRWEQIFVPLERIEEQLAYTWSTTRHLLAVRNSPAMREAVERVQPEVVRFMLRLGQSQARYAQMLALRDGPAWRALAPVQQRILQSALRAARHAGVALPEAARARFTEIQQELARLSTSFSNQLLDARREFRMLLSSEDEVAGLPPSARELAATRARDAGHAEATAEAGPWCITLDAPTLRPFLEHCHRADLRERLYRASILTASAPPHDNTTLVETILRLRKEQADLLGYPGFAELSLASKMAREVDAVRALLERLLQAAYPCAERERAELEAFARAAGGPARLHHWDVPYWAERLREQRFSLTDEELRPYFPLPRVLEGLFALAHELFGVRIEAADGATPVWHPDVRFFRVYDAGPAREPLAAFYLDPFSRPHEKRGGAWMDDCVNRSRVMAPPGHALRLPVAYLVCNQAPPAGARVPGAQPGTALMTFDEVKTLFHEFGHGLQHMLTTIDHAAAAGTNNVEWDAVEIPSLFMENWCYHLPTLRAISGHHETGAPLPETWVQQLIQSRNYRAGSSFLRQLFFGFTDLALHHDFDPRPAGADPFAVMHDVARFTTLLPPLPEDRFLCSFSHIFAGAYAAGYYSYNWAAVLSADVFGAFEEAGLDDASALLAIGKRFRDTFLALGGSRDPREIFRAFRGRDPEPQALLRQYGLVKESTA